MRRQKQEIKKQRLIGRTELLYRVPICWPTLDKRIKQGLFPSPERRFGNGIRGKLMWHESEIEAFIAGTWTARREKVEA
jgi:predicted DNA-binding transcriptional regulator AlpA